MTGYCWCEGGFDRGGGAHTHNFICFHPPSCERCACGRSGLQAQHHKTKKMASHIRPPSSPRIMSAAVKLGRSSSRMSSVSRGSSDEEQTKTAVKVGICPPSPLAHQSRHPSSLFQPPISFLVLSKFSLAVNAVLSFQD